ncbi:MAG TPA: hemerythrin domain-containing protein [Actinomadura sp.]|jgi:iron-sulfur cluster repair protein YtfE (RIC family)|nr:hemerythrin domain-containing protein [Actinomadura sp.]
MASQGRDVITVLTEDHRRVQELMGRVKAATDPAMRRELADEMTIELVRHSVAEEMHVYPAIRDNIPDGERRVQKELADHERIEKILKEMERAEATEPEFVNLLSKLDTEFRQHIQDEESNLFPELAQHVSTEDLIALGQRVEDAKDTAPTRPHPAKPDSPALLKVLAPGVGFVDRIRDRLTGRGRDAGRDRDTGPDAGGGRAVGGHPA